MTPPSIKSKVSSAPTENALSTMLLSLAALFDKATELLETIIEEEKS